MNNFEENAHIYGSSIVEEFSIFNPQYPLLNYDANAAIFRGAEGGFQAIYQNENVVIVGSPRTDLIPARASLEGFIKIINDNLDVPTFIRNRLPKRITV